MYCDVSQKSTPSSLSFLLGMNYTRKKNKKKNKKCKCNKGWVRRRSTYHINNPPHNTHPPFTTVPSKLHSTHTILRVVMGINVVQRATPAALWRVRKVVTPDCRRGDCFVFGEDGADEGGCFWEEEARGEEGDGAVREWAPGKSARGERGGEEDEREEGVGEGGHCRLG